MGGNIMLNKKTKPEDGFEMPYDVNFTIKESFIKDLDNVGSRGMDIGELFKRSAVKSKPLKSNSLKWCKFFKLVNVEGRHLSLSQLGTKYAHATKEEKQEIISNNLPKEYLTILKWISDNEGSMRAEQIKDLFASNWNYSPSKRLANSMINTFARTCDDAGLVKYVKGQTPRIELTKKGYEILSLPERKENTEKEHIVNKDNAHQIPTVERTSVQLISNLGTIEKKIESEKDWDKLKIIIDHWKEIWKVLEEGRKTKKSAD